MSIEKNSRFSVLNQLQELSKESDQFAEQLFPQAAALDGWFSAVKETVLQIKACTSIKDIKNFPEIKSIFGEEQRVINNTKITEAQREHVHSEKNVTTGYETANKNADRSEKSSKIVTTKDKGSTLADIPTSEKKEFEKLSESSVSSKKVNQKLLLPPISTPKMKIQNCSVKSIPNNSSCGSQQVMKTPILDRTFNKFINNTIILNSTFSCASDQKSEVEGNSDMRISRSGSKQKLQDSVNRMQTRSGSKQKLQDNVNQMQTRSGSKRKSSESKTETRKKQKTEACDVTISVSKTKAAPSKHAIKKNILKPAGTENKSKMCAVIVPTMKQNTSMGISKEQQLLEELQKKEAKANENRKKVLAERQLKAEENKQKRNEKMEKTLQKRLLLEKEKEERLEKKETDSKSAQAKVVKESTKKPALKTRVKEVIDQHMKENKSQVVSTSKQNETNGETVFKTPARKSSSDENETYELTPVPDSSTYNFSDDEDEKPSGKPIPLWAQGVHLKSALIHQFYNPADTDKLFAKHIDSPDLAELFGVQKKQYAKRTSSAVWNSPPDRSFHY